jgi:hypothetical protein
MIRCESIYIQEEVREDGYNMHARLHACMHAGQNDMYIYHCIDCQCNQFPG